MTPTQNMGRNTPCRAQPRPVLLVVTPRRFGVGGFFAARVHSLGNIASASVERKTVSDLYAQIAARDEVQNLTNLLIGSGASASGFQVAS